MFNCKSLSTPHRFGVFGTRVGVFVCLCMCATHRLLSDPPHPDVDSEGLPLFGVGEHTDYGYLTLLLQDNSGGLQVKLADGSWIDAPPVQGSLVVNLGDALEHNTGCLIKATPHRVKHTSNANRMSFPFFFDPSFSKRMESIVSQLPEGECLGGYTGGYISVCEGCFSRS